MSTPFESIQRSSAAANDGSVRTGSASLPGGSASPPAELGGSRPEPVCGPGSRRAFGRVESGVRASVVFSGRRSVWVTFGWTARGRCSYSARQRGSTRATGAGVLVLEDVLTRDEYRVSCRSSRVGGCSAPARAQVTDVPGHVRIDLVPGCLVAPRPRMFLRVRHTAVGSDQSQKFRAMGVSRGPGPRHLPRRSRSDPQ